MDTRWYDHFWRMVGGRKNFNSYIATALLTWYGWYAEATFEVFWPPLLVTLGIMSVANVATKVAVKPGEQG
jgi:hypothetical protein